MVDRLVDGWVDKREWVPGGIPQKLVTSPWENHKKTCIETPNFRCISSFSCGKPLVKKYIPLFFETCVDDADDARNMEKHVINRETLQHAAKGKNITSNC
jgi:hypothetical protein